MIAALFIIVFFCAACFGIGCVAGKISSGAWDKYL